MSTHQMASISERIKAAVYRILDIIPISKDSFFDYEVQKAAYAKGLGLEAALKYSRDVHNAAFKAGVPLEDVLKFSDHMQLYAFQKNISLDIALKFSNHAQLHAFQRNISLDKALQFSNHFQLYCYEHGGFSIEKALNYSNGIFDSVGVFFKGHYVFYHDCAPPNIYGICSIPTDFTSQLQFEAYQLGASRDEAVKFRHYFQADALRTGISAEDALKFSELSQVNALKHGLSVADSLKFTKHIQTYALEAGANMEHALKFTSYAQLDALSKGASIAEALQSGVPLEEAHNKVMEINEQSNDICLIEDAYDNSSIIV